jgi:hypothetical protein
MALYTGSPVFLSHTTAVSRWLVMPTAARSPVLRSAVESAWPITNRVFSEISTGLCSTQPARGKICSCSFWPTATMEPLWSKMIARVLVVPWSTARTYCDIESPFRRVRTRQNASAAMTPASAPPMSGPTTGTQE